MNSVEKRRAALANRLGVSADDLEVPADVAADGTAFQLLAGGVYWVYSPDEEKQAFETRLPDVPLLAQICDDQGQTYNVYLSIG